jgi:hypothetical protein
MPPYQNAKAYVKKQRKVDRTLLERPDDRPLCAQFPQTVEQIPIEPLDETWTHVERLHDPNGRQDLFDERRRFAFKSVGGSSDHVVRPSEEGEDADDKGDERKQDATEFWGVCKA